MFSYNSNFYLIAQLMNILYRKPIRIGKSVCGRQGQSLGERVEQKITKAFLQLQRMRLEDR